MISTAYGLLLACSVAILIYMAAKNYENVETRYWTLFIMIPIIILGYWLKSRVTTEEGARTALCILYLDSTVLLVMIVFVLLHYLHIQVNFRIKLSAYLSAFFHLGIVWFFAYSDQYYASVTLNITEWGTITKMTSGPWKIIHWIFLAIIGMVIIGVLIQAIRRKGTYSRRTLSLCLILITVGLLIYVAETLLDSDFSTLPLLYLLSDLLIMKNYDHARMHDITGLISRDMEKSGHVGYAALDLDGRYLSGNQSIYSYLPELKDQIIDAPLAEDSHAADLFHSMINNYGREGDTSMLFHNGSMACKCEVQRFSLKKDGNVQGYLFSIRDVTKEEETKKQLELNNETLNKRVDEKTENIRSIQQQVVLGLANMIENRDDSTGGHVKRTSDIIGFIVDAVRRQGVYQIDDAMAQDIVRAAPMHDLGKITVENAILQKKGRLTPEEYEQMKEHSAKSGEFVHIILKDVEEEHFVHVAYNVARYHHERWDGKGYPEGLVGEMIPLEARIMAIADVYDALVSKRCYKPALSFSKAAEIMKEGMGTQFDPNMYTVFLDCRAQLEQYYAQHG